jgi:hypothetical protein
MPKAKCTKVRYPNKAAALHHSRSMPIDRPEFRVYRCGKHAAETWHMTSKRDIRRDQRKR